MEDIVKEISNVGLTLLFVAAGFIIINWLDKNIFNKDRYRRKK